MTDSELAPSQMPSFESYMTINNPTIDQRRQMVGYCLLNGIPITQEMADKFSVSLVTLKNDERVLRAWYRKQAGKSIGEVMEQELAFAYEQRRACLEQWRDKESARSMQLILQWTERIAKLLGLDAPSKTDDWSDKDWRSYARSQGVSNSELAEGLLRETITLIREVHISPELRASLLDAIESRDITPLSEVDPEKTSS